KRALEIDPRYVEARRGLANVLAHRGQRAWAFREINWCVQVDPSGQTLYAAACVYALAAAASPDEDAPRGHADQALRLLRAALDRGYGRDQFDTDHDLDALRDRPEFRQLLGRVPGLVTG